MAKFYIAKEKPDGSLVVWKEKIRRANKDDLWTDSWIYGINFRYSDDAESMMKRFQNSSSEKFRIIDTRELREKNGDGKDYERANQQ